MYTVARDGSDKRPLLSLEGFYARFSPDGGSIACVGDGGAAGAAIRIVDRGGRVIDRVVLDRVGSGAEPVKVEPPQKGV